MKFNASLFLTLILLTLMAAAGIVSASYGFAIGREALKGITEPDARSLNRGTNSSAEPARQGEVALLKEEVILRNVKAQTGSNVQDTSVVGSNLSNPDKPRALAVASPRSSSAANLGTQTLGLPISSTDQGVTLEIKSVKQDNSALILEVTLRNQGQQSVRFLYSFLDVVDDRGRSVSATTEGLPSEVATGGETFTGTISIPTALLDQSKKLSLALTDYPEQRLKLNITEVPIVR